MTITSVPLVTGLKCTTTRSGDNWCSAKTLFEAYLDATKHSEFTGAPATIEPVEGSAFSLYGGGVEGRNVELVENLRLAQAWRGADWSEGIYSIVRMEFREKNGETLLILDDFQRLSG